MPPEHEGAIPNENAAALVSTWRRGAGRAVLAGWSTQVRIDTRPRLAARWSLRQWRVSMHSMQDLNAGPQRTARRTDNGFSEAYFLLFLRRRRQASNDTYHMRK